MGTSVDRSVVTGLTARFERSPYLVSEGNMMVTVNIVFNRESSRNIPLRIATLPGSASGLLPPHCCTLCSFNYKEVSEMFVRIWQCQNSNQFSAYTTVFVIIQYQDSLLHVQCIIVDVSGDMSGDVSGDMSGDVSGGVSGDVSGDMVIYR